ncbi:MAG: heavy metal translocating P-type ATPase [Rhodobacteraceae bacterium]|nr:heavy metal translocating P-type ATPase [Paracoccaceae bacterium]
MIALDSSSEAARTGEFLFGVQDMHCAGCISALERALSALPEVVSVRVNLTNRRIRILADTETEPERLAQCIRETGYTPIQLDADSIRLVSTTPQSQGLLVRLGIAGFGFANVMIYSVVVWSGAEGTTRDLMHWLSAFVALPVIAYAAQPFFLSALRVLRNFRLNMDVPISLAIILASGQSLFETAQSGQHAYFDAALALVFFLLSGRYLDLQTRMTARSAAAQLSAIEPDTTTTLAEGKEVNRPIGEITEGATIIVRSGDRIPLDGEITTGSGDLDNSFLTGESRPESVKQGDQVVAGQFIHTGRLEIKVTRSSANSSLRRLVKMIELAESARNRYTTLADRAASIYAPAVHLLALLGFFGWLTATGDTRLSINIAVAILIITCPCALGLAVPAVSAATTGRFFRSNLLIKDPDALEKLAGVRRAVLDKTGTLTLGIPIIDRVSGIHPQALAVAGALAASSRHPYAQAIHNHVMESAIPLATLDKVVEIPGSGITGIWNDQEVRLGRSDWVGAGSTGHSATWLRLGGDVFHEFRFIDRIRSGTRECIKGLQDLGIETILMSGDTEEAVRALADTLDIDQWFATARPEDKMAMIDKLTRQDGMTLMVGDGINDAAAMARSDISITPSSALDVTRVAASVVLVGDDVSRIPEAIHLARLAKRRVLENFTIAGCYNAVAVPLAMAGLATPLAAAIAMSTSSIAVTLNSMRMR